jgi:hypothetical protein
MDKHRIVMLARQTLAVLAGLMLFSQVALAAENIAAIKTVKGTVDVLHNGALPAAAAKGGDRLSTGDVIRTKSASSAEVLFNDGSSLTISQRSRIDIGEYYGDKGKNLAKVKLARGKVEAAVTGTSTGSSAKQFEIHTPNAVAGVRGTIFGVYHDGNVTGVYSKEGKVFAYNRRLPDEEVIVDAGMYTLIIANKAPTTPQPGTGPGGDTAGFSGFGAGGTGGFGAGSMIGMFGGMSMPPAVPPQSPPPPSASNVTAAAADALGAGAGGINGINGNPGTTPPPVITPPNTGSTPVIVNVNFGSNPAP